MSAAQFLTAESLRIPGVAHGFFTRLGGVSQGVYASLNGGVGSRDTPQAVTENRARIAAGLGAAPERLAVPFQIHSPDAVAITELWPESARPRCDALVTATPGLALGVTGADCGMILFADQRARVIGAAHAGWKGALTGVVEATVTAMERLGAKRSDIVAALGPCIGHRFLRGRSRVRRRLRRRGRQHGALLRPQSQGRPFDVRPQRLYRRTRRARRCRSASRIFASTPTPTSAASSAIAEPPIARSRTMAGSCRSSS